MRVLIVYTLAPEEVRFYVFDEPTDDEFEIFHGAHGTMINMRNENKYTSMLRDILRGREYIGSKEESMEFIEGPFDLVFYSGIVV